MKNKYITKTKTAVFLLISCMLLILSAKAFANSPVIAYADSPGRRLSYKIELENGNKFFYMNGLENEQDNEEFLDLESGLYYTHSLENIYLVESVINQGKSHAKYVYEHDLIISEDGMYFANLPWTVFAGFLSIGKAGVAVEFYDKGCMMKRYNLSDLTWNRIKFTSSVSHITWEDRTKRKFDANNNILSLTTLNNKTIVFDLTTGGIVSKSLSGFEIAVIVVGSVAGVAAVAAVALILWKRKKKKSAAQK